MGKAETCNTRCTLHMITNSAFMMLLSNASFFITKTVFAEKGFTNELSPFLMFDYAAPKQFQPSRIGNRRGVGQHPHRGFETVTIAFQGEVEHKDSNGNWGVIGPGDCQWMTAGKGIVHEEFHSQAFTRRGGMFEMCQLWVNLPKEHKMSEPRYQSILTETIPKVPLRSSADGGGDVCTDEKIALKDGYARIIAGEFQGQKGPAQTFTHINLWDVVILNKKKEFELELPGGHTAMVFVRKGGVNVQGKELKLADMVVMSREGEKLIVQATMKDTSLLILSGEPIDEPIAARGPFVMNSQQELIDAHADFHRGLNGFKHF